MIGLEVSKMPMIHSVLNGVRITISMFNSDTFTLY